MAEDKGSVRLNQEIGAAAFDLVRQLKKKKQFLDWREGPPPTGALLMSLFTTLPISDLQGLESRLKESPWEAGEWNDLRPDRVRDLSLAGVEGSLLLCMLTCHRNGFVREQAMSLLDSESSKLEFPFLLLRLADWVPQVQARAGNQVRRRLTEGYAPVFIHCFGLMEKVVRSSRFPHDIVMRMEAILVRPACAVHLQAGLASKERAIRKRCFRLALQSPGALNIDLWWRALRDEDVVARKEAFSQALTLLPAQRSEILLAATLDAYAKIRSLALDATLQDRKIATAEQLSPFLLDRTAYIRGDAQAALNKQALNLAPEFYRRCLNAKAASVRAAAVYGVAETGHPEDASQIASI